MERISKISHRGQSDFEVCPMKIAEKFFKLSKFPCWHDSVMNKVIKLRSNSETIQC